MCTETFVFKDPERYQSMSTLTSEFIPPSKFTTPSESDTHCASLASSLPFSLATSTVDYFEDQCLIANPSYEDSSNVCWDTLDNFQSDIHSLAPQSHIQWPSTPLLPLFWAGNEYTFNESAHNAEATLVCNPADIVLPQSSVPSQAKRRADETTGCHVSAGDNPPATSRFSQSPHFSNILDTLPQIEPDLDLDPTLTKENIWKTCSTLIYDAVDPTFPDGTVMPPHWIFSNQIENSLDYPREQSLARPLSQHPYENLAFTKSGDWGFCCFSNEPEPRDYGSPSTLHQFFALGNKQSDNVGLLHPNDTGIIPLGEMQESHYPTTKEASLTGFDDTVRSDQAVQYDCSFISPYTGEPCKDICSRVYD
ncbi:hypothetical protein PENANT_c167G02720 [Penicillium antarcticum]|uniref:Uncharacterized protein n=1 Tax=Penicillium antarcticum TaxID=416450 RepID=A0A1V6PD92_9EURO|nr:hypothetical protein PENANT_c167G02720 [Penicillium antarcticum]